MLTKEIIEKHLSFFKRKTEQKIQKLDYNEAIKYLGLFAKLSYNYNLFYTDDKAEEQLNIISNSLFGIQEIQTEKNKIIFYDSFAMDNRGLTQQYLRAFFSWDCDLLYITNGTIGADILTELQAYPKAKIVSYDKNKINEFKTVIKEITNFNPEKVFLHFSPWDIAGFCIWNSIKNVDRFLINLTDHAFWLGKHSFDYVLEFRGYGAYLSLNERKIPLDKLLLQPYYPIINNKAFQGFSFDNIEQKTIAFAGSNLYKIAGRNNLFLQLIKEVLLKNKDLIFVLAGPGDNSYIKKFIKENNFEDCFFLLGNRKDINTLVKNIDIYVNTFPMIGGLMSQYAAFYHKPIIGYTSSDLYWYNNTEDLLQVSNKKLLVKENKDEFINYFNQLISSEETKNENIQHTFKCVSTPEYFNARLYQNVYKHEHIILIESLKDISIDLNTISDLYIDMENSYLKNHYPTILTHMKLDMLFYLPFQFLNTLYLKRKIIFKKIFG